MYATLHVNPFLALVVTHVHVIIHINYTKKFNSECHLLYLFYWERYCILCRFMGLCNESWFWFFPLNKYSNSFFFFLVLGFLFFSLASCFYLQCWLLLFFPLVQWPRQSVLGFSCQPIDLPPSSSAVPHSHVASSDTVLNSLLSSGNSN